MFGFMRKDPTYFTMFSDIAKNLIAGAHALVDLFDNYPTRDEKRAEIKRIEHIGDDITHSVLTKLNQTFITPFDREDIHRLATSLDDVLDFIHAAGERLVMYKILAAPPSSSELAQVIVKQCAELASAVSMLEKHDHVLEHCVEINRLENEADRIARDSIARLFEREKDPIALIKMKELYEVLETATDKAEDAANVLETVVLKGA